MYVYYTPVVINSNNNTLNIQEILDDNTSNNINIILDNIDFNTYSYTILNNNLQNDILAILNIKLSVHLFQITLENDTYKILKTGSKFKMNETSLSKLLGFDTTDSINGIKYGIVPKLHDFLSTNDYYKYYGDKLHLNYKNLNVTESNSIISIDLEEDKHINLPDINEGLIYTFIINNSIKNKKLFIHSLTSICNIDTNLEGNVLVVNPSIDKKLKVSIVITSNDNKYFIIDTKGIDYTLNLYSVHLYNKNNNFNNLYYTINGLSNIDKYISIYGIHIIGLKDANNSFINEQKFLHVAKTLARVLDYNQTKTIYDNNIHNSVLSKNSYILLYNNNIPTDYFDSTKHHNNIFIKYSNININYDYTQRITSNNNYDITLEKIIHLLLFSYIYTYPHIFNFKQLEGNTSDLNIYKYINNDVLTGNLVENSESNNVYIRKLTTIDLSKTILNTYYNNSENINYCVGSDLTIQINNLTIKNNLSENLRLSYSIVIINIGNGYKNNDKVKFVLDSDFELILTLNTIDISDSSKLYTVYNSFNELTSKVLNKLNFTNTINNIEDSLFINQNGLIKTDNIIDYNISLNQKLYNKSLQSTNDVVIYVTDLLLALLGYHKYKNEVNNYLSNIDFNIITPTLVKEYNNKFVGLYLSSSLKNINNLTNINNYNLDLIDYIKSNNNQLIDLQLSVSNISKITDFDNLVLTYDNIVFDNVLKFNIITENQYSVVETSAKKNNIDNLPIINNNTTNPIIDVSSVVSNDYFNTIVNVVISVTSESGLINNYNINLNRAIEQNNISTIDTINTLNNDILLNSISNISTNIAERLQSNNIVYFRENIENKIQIILSNIYSNITQITINNQNQIESNVNLDNSYSYEYVFTPTYYRSNINIEVTAEDIITTNNYSLVLQKFPNNIALLDNIIISNVENINNFNTYNFNYNGRLNKNVYNIFTTGENTIIDNLSNISITINKTDIYSSVNTSIEYLDSSNNYILYKQTNETFIYDIFTFHKKDVNTYKNIIINKDHTFYNIYPIEKWDPDTKSFILDIADPNSSTNSVIFKSIENKSNVKVRNSLNHSTPQWTVNSPLNQAFIPGEIYKVNYNIATYPKHIQIAENSGNYDNILSSNTNNAVELTNCELLIESKPFKLITNDLNTEILNISNIDNVRITINVTSEDRTITNSYVYIINIK